MKFRPRLHAFQLATGDAESGCEFALDKEEKISAADDEMSLFDNRTELSFTQGLMNADSMKFSPGLSTKKSLGNCEEFAFTSDNALLIE